MLSKVKVTSMIFTTWPIEYRLACKNMDATTMYSTCFQALHGKGSFTYVLKYEVLSNQIRTFWSYKLRE